MKKNLLLLAVLALTVSPALAGVDVRTSTEPYFLKNSHYSDEMIRLIQLDKQYVNGIPATTQTKTNIIDAIFNYIDPGLDDGKFFVRGMPQNPGFNDL